MIPAVSLAQQKVYGSQLNSAQTQPAQSNNKANVSFGNTLMDLGLIGALIFFAVRGGIFIAGNLPHLLELGHKKS